MAKNNMVNNFKNSLFGWETSDLITYREVHALFGGCINTHPDVLEFLINKGEDIHFFHYKSKGNLLGALFLNNKKEIGVDVWRKYPISFDEIILPLSKQAKFFIPNRCKRLSPVNANSVRNISFGIFSKKNVCLAKEQFSKKNVKNRRNEFNKFVREGGRVLSVDDVSTQELVNIYISLFNKRFAGEVKCYSENNLLDIITSLRHMTFGNILFVHDTPCAFDLIFKSHCNEWIYFDVPNGGVDPSYSHLSVGSILMSLNIDSAKQICEKYNKKMFFSLGVDDERWEYKFRWADRVSLGRVLTL